jgi:hypothetical protein|tara:strand:+ start:374 stop:535 length:162 start_codon:yes stop_codon:yes gene_type:complete
VALEVVQALLRQHLQQQTQVVLVQLIKVTLVAVVFLKTARIIVMLEVAVGLEQ